jgi:tetratricopeptide (TPR) repeat protein
VRWGIAQLPGASFPYALRAPLLTVLGVPLQEIAGWAIVAYLGWWLGCRASRYLFPQVALACLFLGAASWSVECAAVAAGWWRWTLPVDTALFLNVPSIALVDWAFVGLDFLLPFLALTAPALRQDRRRFLSLLAFPLHFLAHGFADRTFGPIPLHHLAHWLEIGVLCWLALRSETSDTPFADSWRWLPGIALAVVLLDAGLVDLLLGRRPELLVSILPALAIAAQAFLPAAGFAAGACALILGAWLPSLLPATLPAALAGVLRLGRNRRPWAAAAAVAILVPLAFTVHARAARGQQDLVHGLDAALAARDRGDLAEARRELQSLSAQHPGSHVPLVLLGEITYRTDSLEEARDAFARAADIKGDDPKTYRYLAVIERRLGHPEQAERLALRGLEIAPSDPELRYLAGHRVEPRDPATAQALASLAYEVGDVRGAAAFLDGGLALWPEERSFYPGRVKLALQAGDQETARRVLAAWLARFPGDAEARAVARHLGGGD